MGTGRLGAFEALVERASGLLLRGEQDNNLQAVAEARMLIDFLRRRYAEPFTPDELRMMLDGADDQGRTVSSLLAFIKSKRPETRKPAPAFSLPSGALTAAE